MECTLCLGIEELSSEDHSYHKSYINVCNKYLTAVEITGLEKETQLILCTFCIPLVEKLLRIHKKLEKIKNRLAMFSNDFSDTLIRRRSKKKRMDTDEECDIARNIKIEQLDQDFQTLDDDSFPIDGDNEFPKAASSNDHNYYNVGNNDSNLSNSEESDDTINSLTLKKAHKNGDMCVDKHPATSATRSRLTLTKQNKKVTPQVRVKEEINESDNGNSEAESKTVEQEESFQCKICKKSFTDKVGYNNHRRLHKNNSKEHLNLLGKKLASTSSDFRNISSSTLTASESKGNTLKCKKCKRTFKERRYLLAHEKVHLEDREFVCDICNKTFKWARNLVSHKRTVHTNHSTEKEKLISLPNGEKTFACEKCEKSFASAHYLRCHEKVHTVERTHVCGVCGKAFRWKKNLTDHLKVVHSIGTIQSVGPDESAKSYSCSVCGMTDIISKKMLGKHMTSIHPEEKPFPCTTCDKKFATEYYLRCHEKVHSVERTHVCGICSKAFRWKKNLVGHQKIHAVDDTEKPKPASFWCSLCGRSFESVTHLVNHVSVQHPDETLFICEVCGKNFEDENLFESHKLLHKYERVYMCALCGKSFNWRKNLLAHRKSVHGLDNLKKADLLVMPKALDNDHRIIATQSCPECGKILSSKVALIEHMRLHTGETPFQCDQEDCKLNFRTLANLKSHKINAHSTEYPFLCDKCDARFKFKSQLSRHMTDYHPTLDKLHICELCGRSFKRGYRLKDHMRTHTEESQFKCGLCDRKFNFKNTLVTHVKLVHTQEISFECDICGRQLSSKTNLDDHVRTHTKEKPYECNVCSQLFSSTTNLSKHRKTTGH